MDATHAGALTSPGQKTSAPTDQIHSRTTAETSSPTQDHGLPALSLDGIIGVGLIIIFLFSIFYYHRRLKGFEKTYSEIAKKLPRDISTGGGDPLGAMSPGQMFALASRGPSYAFDAELRSAEIRWRHVISAFPQLDSLGSTEKTPLILIPTLYTNIHQVHEAQRFISRRIKDRFHQNIIVPSWADENVQDFDVLKYPELAIANRCIYSLPFFLTWERRRLWGVLPYAIHTRLGVLISTDHPSINELATIEEAYRTRLVNDTAYGLWVQDPGLVRWLSALMREAGTNPVRVDRTNPDLKDQHVRPTVFAVGAYLQQELLPLACAVLGDQDTASRTALHVQKIEPTELRALMPEPSRAGTSESVRPQSPSNGGTAWSAVVQDWPVASAIIIDLVLCNEPAPDSGWKLLRLPHCVYVPIGIGYSVLAWPLLAQNTEARRWTANLLSYSADMLRDAADELSIVGIELDDRLWQHLEGE